MAFWDYLQTRLCRQVYKKYIHFFSVKVKFTGCYRQLNFSYLHACMCLCVYKDIAVGSFLRKYIQRCPYVLSQCMWCKSSVGINIMDVWIKKSGHSNRRKREGFEETVL